MKVIMLRGKAGCGKTTTMHQVFDDIFKKIDKTDDVIIPMMMVKIFGRLSGTMVKLFIFIL